MATTSTATSESGASGESGARRGPISWVGDAVGGVRRFIRQVVWELKKVVRPTRKELLTYTAVVLVFVCAVMAYTQLLDIGFGKLIIWAFAAK